MKNNKAMVAFYGAYPQAEEAVIALNKSGFTMEMLSIVDAKDEVLKNKSHNNAGNFMLIAYGTEALIKKAAVILKISLIKDDLKRDYPKRVLSGGETSSFQ